MALTDWGLFNQIGVGFLLIDHTHKDIDQAFSTTSDGLVNNNGISLEDLHNELAQTYNEMTRTAHMKRAVTLSGLCKQEKWLHPVRLSSQFCYVLFRRSGYEIKTKSGKSEML